MAGEVSESVAQRRETGDTVTTKQMSHVFGSDDVARELCQKADILHLEYEMKISLLKETAIERVQDIVVPAVDAVREQGYPYIQIILDRDIYRLLGIATLRGIPVLWSGVPGFRIHLEFWDPDM